MAAVFDAKEFGNVHKFVLQCMLQKGTIRVAEAVELLRDSLNLFQVGLTESDDHLPSNAFQATALTRMRLHETLQSANEHLRPLHLEIKRTMCEYTGQMYLHLVNRLETDNSASWFDELDEKELKFFNKLLLAVVKSESGKVQWTDALNLAVGKDKLGIKDGKLLLEKLVNQNWVLSANNKVMLHPRAIAELQPMLVNCYKLDQCPECHTVVVASEKQQCSVCGKLSHLCCLKRFAKKRKAPLACLHQKCKQEWVLESSADALLSSRQQSSAEAGDGDEPIPSAESSQTSTVLKKRRVTLEN